jgi:Zn-dependent peptidase ImmA (M78 family)/transcriptional regulator with XRE-family HTH domain
MEAKEMSGSPFGRQVARERGRRKWSLRDLAEHSGLSHSRIRRIETDPNREITLDDVLTLADAFGVPASWLVRGAAVRDRVLTAARTRDGEDAEVAVDQIVHVLELSQQLDSIANSESAGMFITAMPRADQESVREWGRTKAEWIRRVAGVPSHPIHDLPAFIEAHTGAYVVIDDLPQGVDGVSLRDPDMGYAVAAASTALTWERQRFTLAHELGHLLAGQMMIEEVNGRTRNPEETAAHEFARNLLIPVGDLVAIKMNGSWTAMDAARVAWDYRVSPHVVGIQLERAGLGTRRLTNDLMQVSSEAWSRVGGWAPERESLAAAASARRIPPRLAERALEAWRNRRIPAATIGRLLNYPTEQVEVLLEEVGVEQADVLAD